MFPETILCLLFYDSVIYTKPKPGSRHFYIPKLSVSHYKTGLYCHNIDCFSTLPLGFSLISLRQEHEHSKEETVFAFYITGSSSQGA